MAARTSNPARSDVTVTMDHGPFGSQVIKIWLPASMSREEARKVHERADRICRCRRHWWELWRRQRTCDFEMITVGWEPYEDENDESTPADPVDRGRGCRLCS